MVEHVTLDGGRDTGANRPVGRPRHGLTRLGQAIDWINTRLDRFALESAIQANATEVTVSELLRPCQLFVLGGPAGDTSVPGQAIVLHFDVRDDEGHEHTILPIFTRRDIVRAALLRNPDWPTVDILEVPGEDLLDTRDPDVTLVIDPWSRLEFIMRPQTLFASDRSKEQGSQIGWLTSGIPLRSMGAAKGVGWP